MFSKAENELYHFKERYKKRFHQNITDEDVNNIILMIQSSKSKVIKKQSNKKTRHQITYNGKTFDVVYDTTRHMLVTAMYSKGITDVKQRRNSIWFQ